MHAAHVAHVQSKGKAFSLRERRIKAALMISVASQLMEQWL